MKERTMLEKIQRTAQRINAIGSNGRKAYPLGTPFDFIRKDYEGASAPSVPAVKADETPDAVELVAFHKGGGSWSVKRVDTGEVVQEKLGGKTEANEWIEAQEDK